MKGVEIAGRSAVEVYVNRKFLAPFCEFPPPDARGLGGYNTTFALPPQPGLYVDRSVPLVRNHLHQHGNFDSVKVVHSDSPLVQIGIGGFLPVRGDITNLSPVARLG